MRYVRQIIQTREDFYNVKHKHYVAFGLNKQQ